MSRKSSHKNKEALSPFYHKNHFHIAKMNVRHPMGGKAPVA